MWKHSWFRVFSALILTMALVLTDVLADVGSIRAEAAESVGEAQITPGASIAYGGWSTNKFTVKTEEATYLGYCAQPMSATPRGTYSYEVYTGKNADEIKLMAYIGSSDTKAAADARNNLFAGIPNETTRYGYIHAVIGYLYSGQTTGLNAGTIDGVMSITAGLRNLISTWHPLWTSARKLALYVARNNSQDIVWVGEGDGYVQLTKKAATNMFAAFTEVYSLEGARYGIYKDQECTSLVKELVCDAQGEFSKVQVPSGTYYVKELEAPRGFALCRTVKRITVQSGMTAEVTLVDQPQGDPVPVLLEKRNSETGDTTGWGDADLSGALYTYRYYAVTKDAYQSMPEEERQALEPDVTWVFRTDAGGHIQVSDRNAMDTYLVSGDLFCDVSGNVIYPIGTYQIEETQAPDGFLIDPAVHTVFIDYDMGAVTDENEEEIYFIHSYNEGDNAVRMEEQPIRGDLEFAKADEETGNFMAGIPFELSLLSASGDVEETHTIVTDENGEVHTQASIHPHTQDTNGGTAMSGIWFGNGSEPADSVGALPYGTYRLTELPCEENADRDLLEVEFVIHENLQILDLGTLYNRTIYIHTMASCTDTGSRTIPDSGAITLTDVVEYRHLTPGRTYVCEGTLVDKRTGEICISGGEPVTASTEFVPDSEDGTTTVSFALQAEDLERGSTYVVFEKLYDRESERTSHEDLEDRDQSIYMPRIMTHAADSATMDHVGTSVGETVIVDRVEYEGLAPNEDYLVSGCLMDRDTGKIVTGVDGAPVETSVGFTAEASSGSIELEFPISETLAAGRSFTVFETLYQNACKMTAHEDLYDEEQTVVFPAISTHAEDGTVKDPDHSGVTAQTTTIIDEVTYRNLLVGKNYQVKGTLMNQSSGEPVCDEEGVVITAEMTFEAVEADGTVELIFDVPSYLLAGETVVVYEDLLYREIPVAVHHDLYDEEQSIHYPKLATTAQNPLDNTHTLAIGEETEIIDTVSYQNLIPGKQYMLKGVLMDRETAEPCQTQDGENLVSEITFNPETADGEQQVSFTLNTDQIPGKKLVVFEYLYLVPNEEETPVCIGSHEDLFDEGQTIYVPELRTQASSETSKTREGVPASREVITDRVMYKGLTPGKTYTISGILMDKSSRSPLLINGKEIRAVKEFIPESCDGEIQIEFVLDSSALYGKTIVVFESLIYEEREVTSHADIEDEEQSIHYKKKPKGPSIRTGDDTSIPGLLLLLLMTFCVMAGGFVLVLKRRRR